MLGLPKDYIFGSYGAHLFGSLASLTALLGSGPLQPLAAFMTNPAGSAIVNAAGPIRQIVDQAAKADKRYLVIASGEAAMPGETVQIETR